MIKHLFNNNTSIGLIDSKDVKSTIENHSNMKMLELKLFSPNYVYRQNKNRRHWHNKKLRRGLHHELARLKPLEYYKVMLRGSGTLILHCALRNNGKKLHLICLNFAHGYLYEGGQTYLPFNPKQKLEKRDALAILAKLNVARVMNAWLIVHK